MIREPAAAPPELKFVGKRIPMLEGPAKASGTAVYVDDMVLPGMLHGAILRSPHAHALIKSIDASAALAMPGVHAVITAADQGPNRYIHLGGLASDRYPMASDRVRFVGEEVAGVAADTPELARLATERIEVRYSVLPAVFDPFEAMRAGSVEVHPAHTFEVERSGKDNAVLRRAAETERNVSSHSVKLWGQLDAVFSSAHRIFEHDYYTPQETHVAMEPDGSIVSFDSTSGRFDVWTSTQSPYFIEKEMANALGVETAGIHVHEVVVGGGFGGKSKICDHEVIAALLSRKCGRPVKLILSRDEQFATTKSRHSFHTRIRTGVTSSGVVVARDMTCTVDNGAYNAVGPAVMGIASLICASLYRPLAARFDGRLVYTNKLPGGQFRGYGNPQATFPIECQMDVIATELGIDPIELRRRNLNRPGDTTLCNWKITSCAFEECLDAVADILATPAAEEPAPGRSRGVGVAAMIHCTGANIYQDGDFSEADVEVHGDGRVVYRMGAADPGTWQNTVLAQIVAESLGVDVSAVSVVTMDSDDTPTDLGTWGSRITFVAGNAAQRAGAQARLLLRQAAAEHWEAELADVELDGSVLQVRGVPARRMSVGEAVAHSPAAQDGRLSVHMRYATPTEMFNRETGNANIAAAYTFAVQGAEVEVDTETGAIEVRRFVAAHDVGRAINPIAVEGQIEGASVMGLGAALTEELIFEQGKLVNGSYLFYGVPRAADMPPINDVVVEGPDEAGPYGAKGVGEAGLVPTSPAVANAVTNATGARMTTIPLTPDRILGALGTPIPAVRPMLSRPGMWEVALLRALYPRLVLPILHRFGTRFARRRRSIPAASLSYSLARTVAEATRAAASTGAEFVAGATDVMPRRRQRLLRSSALVDVTGIPELRRIERTADGLHIGAAVTLNELVDHPEVAAQAPLLVEVVARIASDQIRNAATVAGNLCQEKRCWFYRQDFQCYKRGGVTCPCYAVVGDNRFYHAIFDAHRCQAVAPSDLATALAALEGYVNTVGAGGRRRRLDMRRLYVGPGETTLAVGELITEVVIPTAWLGARFGYEKLRLRYGDFPIVAAAVTRNASGEHRIVLGGVSARPRRDAAAERLATAGATIGEVANRAVYEATPLPGNRHKVAMARAVVAAALRRARDSEVTA